MISVIMAAYNASEYIAEAIQSILNQTYTKFELIIINDGSTDNTCAIVEEFLSRDDRIRLIQGKHGGASQARNLGIAQAKYRWIAIMDADDIALPDRFQKQLEYAERNPNVVVWGSYVHHINNKGRILSLHKVGPKTEREFYQMKHNGELIQVMHPTALISREALLETGTYDTTFTSAEDLELFDRLSEYGQIIAIPEPLVLYRVHDSSLSMSDFFTMQQYVDYVRDRIQRRLKRQPSVSFNDFLEGYQNLTWLTKLQRKRIWLAGYNYRAAGMYYGEGNYLRLLYHLFISILCKPSYVMGRLYNQMYLSFNYTNPSTQIMEIIQTPQNAALSNKSKRNKP